MLWWMIHSLESFGFWLGECVAQGTLSVGEKVAGKTVPAGRPMDKWRTARRMSQDQKELYNLYKKLLSYSDQAQDTCTTVCWGAVITALDPTPDDLTNPFVLAANQLCQDILHYERYFPLPEIDLTRELPLGEIWELKALIQRCLTFYDSKEQQERVGWILRMILLNLLLDPERRPWLDEKLIRIAGEDALFFATLESIHANIPQAIEAVADVFGQTCTQEGEPFPRLYKKIEDNFLHVSGIDPHRREHRHKQPVLPRQAKGKTPFELISMYLNATPFPDFLTTAFTLRNPA